MGTLTCYWKVGNRFSTLVELPPRHNEVLYVV